MSLEFHIPLPGIVTPISSIGVTSSGGSFLRCCDCRLEYPQAVHGYSSHRRDTASSLRTWAGNDQCSFWVENLELYIHQPPDLALRFSKRVISFMEFSSVFSGFSRQ